MERSFPQTLSALRRERNISQRQAAAELNISQALLSHYENGAREPGLSFVCRACDYYQVSADYLLCRSDEPNAAARVLKAAYEIVDGFEKLSENARKQLEKIEDEIC